MEYMSNCRRVFRCHHGSMSMLPAARPGGACSVVVSVHAHGCAAMTGDGVADANAPTPHRVPSPSGGEEEEEAASLMSVTPARTRNPLSPLSAGALGGAAHGRAQLVGQEFVTPARGERGAGARDTTVAFQLAKTKLCAFFERGKCSSTTCRYAHSMEELRQPPNLQKTKLCKDFLQGSCEMGENCSYAHGEDWGCGSRSKVSSAVGSPMARPPLLRAWL